MPEMNENTQMTKEMTKKEARIAQLKELRQKEIDRHEAKMEYYDNLIATWEAKGDKMNGVKCTEGDVIAFQYGRPGHVMEDKEGVVVGFKEFEKGGLFIVVRVGEGADMEVLRVRPSQVTSVEVQYEEGEQAGEEEELTEE